MNRDPRRDRLAAAIRSYRDGLISNWELQDIMEESAEVCNPVIWQELDVLFDDFPEYKVSPEAISPDLFALFSRIAAFIESSSSEEVRRPVPDGRWPFD